MTYLVSTGEEIEQLYQEGSITGSTSSDAINKWRGANKYVLIFEGGPVISDIQIEKVDFNNDGVIDFTDTELFFQEYNDEDSGVSSDLDYDLTGDGAVTTADVTWLGFNHESVNEAYQQIQGGSAEFSLGTYRVDKTGRGVSARYEIENVGNADGSITVNVTLDISNNGSIDAEENTDYTISAGETLRRTTTFDFSLQPGQEEQVKVCLEAN